MSIDNLTNTLISTETLCGIPRGAAGVCSSFSVCIMGGIPRGVPWLISTPHKPSAPSEPRLPSSLTDSLPARGPRLSASVAVPPPARASHPRRAADALASAPPRPPIRARLRAARPAAGLAAGLPAAGRQPYKACGGGAGEVGGGVAEEGVVPGCACV